MLRIVLIISCSLLPLGISTQAKMATSKVAVDVHALQCGENNVSDLSVFSPGADRGVKKRLVVTCYIIQHPRGTLAWDTGLSDGIAKHRDGISVRDGVFRLKVTKPLATSYKDLGFDPAKIDYLSISHLHPDHSGNILQFTKATILIQAKEFAAAFGNAASAHAFNPKLYPPKSSSQYQIIDGDHDLFGDGSVVMLSTPGHTPGHQSLFLRTKKYGNIVLSGDLYHFAKNRKHRRVPVFNHDKEMTLKSMARLERLLKDKRANLWIQHDPDSIQFAIDATLAAR